MKPYYEQSYWDSLFSWKELEYLINKRPIMDKKTFTFIFISYLSEFQNGEKLN